jgi:hypothetical protein
MRGPTVVSPFLFSAASEDAPSTLLQRPVEVIERRSNLIGHVMNKNDKLDD